VKRSASSCDPLETSNEDVNPIRAEKFLPFFSFQMLLVLCHGYYTSPTRDARTAIEESWWGSDPVDLNLGLRHVTLGRKKPQGGVRSGELRNGMLTRFMERGGQNSHRNLVEVIVSFRWLLDHSTVHCCRLDHFLDLSPSSGFGFTSRRWSCIDDPSTCFCVSSDDRSSSQSIQCYTIVANRIRLHPPEWAPAWR
jgi:hypothetical protein